VLDERAVAESYEGGVAPLKRLGGCAYTPITVKGAPASDRLAIGSRRETLILELPIDHRHGAVGDILGRVNVRPG